MIDKISITLTLRDIEVIRMALRTEYTNHMRNDFKALAAENEDLRSYLVDATIDAMKENA
jgi:hypothetical protein